MKGSVGQNALMIVACIVVLSLLLLTDFAPRQENSFEGLEDRDGRFQVLCVIVGAKPAKEGTLLQLEDSEGLPYKGYCRYGIFENDTALPATARITGTVERTSQGIIFIEKVEMLVSPTGQD